MVLNSLKSIDAEIRQLEARKKLVEKRDEAVANALAVLKKYADVLTRAQRRQIEAITADAGDGRTTKVKRATRKRGRSGKVAPKFQLPSGETWSGRGLRPRSFVAWEKSAEGKAWRQAHAGERFPLIAGSVPPDKVRRKAAAKRVSTKSVKKVAKRRTAG